MPLGKGISGELKNVECEMKNREGELQAQDQILTFLALSNLASGSNK